MLSREIRHKFLSYFKEKGHAIVPSSPTLPRDDPSLLFTNAGMNQFKEVFLGKEKRPYTKATSAQKCIRVGGKHNDLDNVGHTSRHMTFFEMLGNFSFGAYGKREAIEYAFEVSTQIFKFSSSAIWASVFEEDDESFELWQAHLPKERIVRFGKSENFWTMGETGPCGPCSELLFDRGAAFGAASSPLEDPTGERYIEYWNLVFMQFNRQKSGEMIALPTIAVDTGAGLERIVSLMMGTATVFQTDLLRELIGALERVTQVTYVPSDQKLAPAFHVIADHVRTLCFAIADGSEPGNSEQGYVLRKILRRAVRYGRLLGMEKPFLSRLVPTLIEVMGDEYGELKGSSARIYEILNLEEENFDKTLRRGGHLLSSIIETARESGNNQMSGADAFKLKDTYGFPIEEILLIAKDTNIAVNLDAYQLLEEEAREKSRRVTKKGSEKRGGVAIDVASLIAHHGKTTFTGYATFKGEVSITAIFAKGELVETISAGEEGILFLDETPFYAEKGGQVSDIGTLSHNNGLFKVATCRELHPDLIGHSGKLLRGTFMVGEPVIAQIDTDKREAIARNHTATHLLHFALEELLGHHIRQAGSLVDADRLRFDFTHHKALTREMIFEIEQLVNQKIRENDAVVTVECPLEEVQKEGGVKQFFGDKYGAHVRVVSVGSYSKELCGGTHVERSGSIGLFKVVKEGSIGQGIRRIEACTGKSAEQFCDQSEHQLLKVCALLKANAANVACALEAKLAENEELIKVVAKLRYEQLKGIAKELGAQARKIGPFLIVTEIAKVDRKELLPLADLVLKERGATLVCLAIKDQEKCHLFLKLSPEGVKLGLSAATLIKEVSPLVQGSGGGKKEAAQAGGKHPDGIKSAFKALSSLFENHLDQNSLP